MPIDTKNLKDQPAGVAGQDVNNQLGNPEDDISNGYLEKRTIHEELNSPLMRALKKYGGETKKTVPQDKAKIKEEGKYVKTEYGIVPGFIPTEDIPEHQRLYGEEKSLEDPWFDPVMVGFTAGGMGGKMAWSATQKIAPTLFRAMTTGGVSIGADLGISIPTEKVGEKYPALALPFNVIIGMVSGATVENAIEKGVMKYFTKKGIKPAQALIDETTKTVRKNLEAGKIADEATKEVADEINDFISDKALKGSPWQMTKKQFLDQEKRQYPDMPQEGYFVNHPSKPLSEGSVKTLMKEGDYLYHYTPMESVQQIGKSGLGGDKKQILTGRGKYETQRIKENVYGLTESTPDFFDNAISRDSTYSGPWAVLRFKRTGEWIPDPEFKKIEEAGISWMKKGKIPAKQIEILTPDGWSPINEITWSEKPEHYAEIVKAISEGKPVPSKVLADYPDLLQKVNIGTKSPQSPFKQAILDTQGKGKTEIDKLMNQRKRVLVEVKGIQEKVDKFLTTDISDLPEKAININFARIESEDDIKAVIAKTADIFSEGIQEARRGVISNEQTERVADMMGMSVNQLLSRRKGEAFNAETAVASRKILVSSASRLNELAQKVASREASDLDKFAFQKQLSIHYAIQAEVSGMTAEAGRALQSFRITAKESPGALKQIDEVMKSLGQRSMKDPITGKQMQPEDIADLLISIDSIEGINTFTRQIRKATTFDMILEAWINGLLSGPQTHSVNMTSNMLTAFWQIPERFLAAKIGRYLPGPQEIHEREALYQAWGLVQGFKDGMKAFTKNIITGEEPDQFMKMDLPQRRAIASQNFGLESGSVAARAIDLLGEGARLPTRFLGAVDAFFKSIGYRMELNARAFRQASSEGLEGAALSKRINEIISDPPDDIKLASVDAANYQTFTRELGEGGRAGMKFLSKNPALRLIVPFVRTPANIVKFMGERTPLAFVSKNIRADIAAGGAKRDLALARISLGSMIMATVATMTSAGLITGGGPEDPTLKSIKRNTGWQPYSMKVGDKYYSYNRLEPIGMLFGVAADTAEIIGQVNEEDAKTLALAGVMAFAKNVTSKTWLRGTSEAIQALDDPVRYGERFIQGYAKTIIPTGVAQIARTQDPVARSIYHPDGFWYETYNAIKSRVPGWSKSLPPRRNLWGEAIALEGGLGPDIMSPIYTSTERHSPIDNELMRLKYGARMPEATQKIMGVDIPMTAKEYDQYLQVMNTVTLPQTGMNLKKSLDNLVTKNPMYKMQETDDDKIDLIRQYISTAKKWANGPLGIYEKNRKIREDVDNARFRLQREARKP